MYEKRTDFSIPLSVPEISGNERVYVEECLKTGWISSAGPFVNRFEKDFAKIVQVPHAIAVSCGTSALHLALMLAGVHPEDEVFVPTLTFIAPANAIRYVGAVPVFVDCDDFAQMDAKHLRTLIDTHYTWDGKQLINRKTKRRASTIVPVHMLGHSCDLDPLLAIASEFGLTVIEDACEGLGTYYKGKHVGNFGKLSCFSFNGNKLISTGGGGMIVTRDEKLAERCRYLSTQAKDNPIEFIHHAVGYNYRLTNLAAAVGCAQLEQLGKFIERKHQIASLYKKLLEPIPGISPMSAPPWSSSTFWLYTALVDKDQFGLSAKEIVYKLMERGIQSRPLFEPMHLSKAFADVDTGIQRSYARAEIFHKSGLSLPCSVGLKDSEIELVVREISSLSK